MPARRRLALPLLLASLGMAAPVRAQNPAVSTAPLPLDSQVVTGVLPNGLRYFVRANPKPEKRAELRLAVNVGSVLEDDDQRGLAHFTEHMAFNGTRHFEKNALVHYMESIGMRFGPEVSAYTGFDETVYMLTVPTDSAGLLEKGLEVLDDWAEGQLFDTTEIRKERGVVLEEWRLRRGAAQRIQEKQLRVILGGSRYAERIAIGSDTAILNFDPKALVRFYREWYRPELMAVVAVGDFDPRRIEALIRARFAAIPPGARGRPRLVYDVAPSGDSTRYVVATDPEQAGSSVAVLWLRPRVGFVSEADLRRSLVERLGDAMLNARLGELAQKQDPPFLGASVGHASLVRGSRFFVASAGVKEGGSARGLDAVATELERARRFGFTASELERQKTNILRTVEVAYAERAKTESSLFAGEYVRHFLTGEAVPGVAAEYALARRLLPGISLAEVNATLQESAQGVPRGVVFGGPEKAGVHVAGASELAGVLQAASGRKLESYADEQRNAPLIPSLPPAGRVVSLRVLPQVGGRDLLLANGVRIILKPTDFKSDEVLLQMWSPGGSSLLPERDAPFAGIVPSLVLNMGLGQFSAIQLNKLLAGRMVQLGPFVLGTVQRLNAATTPADLETVLQLIYLAMTAPRVDSGSYLSTRQRLHAAMENRGANPAQVYADSLNAALTRHSARTRPLTAALVDSLELSRALQIFRERFGDAGAATFVVVGSFDVDSIQPLLARYLGALPSRPKHDRWRKVAPETPAGVVRVTVRRGVDPKSQVTIVFSGPFDFNRRNDVVLRSLAQLLNNRLTDVLREELSGAYGVSVNAWSERDPRPAFQLRIGFGCAPERVDELTARVFKELAVLKTSGPDTADVSKVRQQQLRAFESSVKLNEWWVTRLLEATMYDPSFDWPLAVKAAYESLDAPTLQDAARKYLPENRYVLGTLLPEAPPTDRAAP